MDLEQIVAELKKEMERIGKAVELLEQSTVPKPRRGRPPGKTATISAIRAKRRGLTAAGRKRLSEMMKKRWADRRKKPS